MFRWLKVGIFDDSTPDGPFRIIKVDVSGIECWQLDRRFVRSGGYLRYEAIGLFKTKEAAEAGMWEAAKNLVDGL